MRLTEFDQSKSNNSIEQFIERFKPWIAKELELKDLPPIEILDEPVTTSFGGYDHDSQSIKLVVGGRHPVDVMRTLAHELVHYKQDIEGRLKYGDGEDGSPAENEANAEAGVVMRHFNKQHPQYLSAEES